jgi:solute carrier family 25 carnitine/acylcarnitine transporter 20/29
LPPPLPQGYGWFFLAYEATVHAMLEPGQGRDQLTFNQIVTAGIMAGFGLWGSMFPIDTIKSKIQADSFTEPAYKGMADAYKQTIKAEGMNGLFRGYWAAMGRAIPVNAAIFLAVEGMKDLVASDALAGLTQAQPAKL